ncbi:FkbM family methyltransferase [Paraconexibacter antarcticus]|uniref:FkbM family methyltransferase n=1 Tax=Paraconexibacter antarcticus TaxID=2949664 RepID=A0ABY5DP90_9ACTN|nr:FkbM family methyltransferase [Paraconexibacter antarcticus]UTI62612.1 FkbM family methyltransferase [Paraconexibacter antarcticus]
MKLLPARLNDKPHYVFHPVRALRRARYGGPSDDGRHAVASLAWGLDLEVHATEAIGYTILTTGVFDPCVSETLHRLIDPGDVVVDVGANVGYLTSLAAARAGSAGEVHAFEPHPGVYALLQANVARWGSAGVAGVTTHQVALSDHEGTAELNAGARFHENMGLASLSAAPGAAGADDELVPVTVQRLDDVIGDRSVGLLKIDVEGHEPEVLRGAVGLLQSGRVRDLVFEDHDPYPDASTRLVEEAGYQLFALSNDLFGVTVEGPTERGEMSAWPGPSYLATRDPERALARMRPRGWQIEGIGPALPWGARRDR